MRKEAVKQHMLIPCRKKHVSLTNAASHQQLDAQTSHHSRCKLTHQQGERFGMQHNAVCVCGSSPGIDLSEGAIHVCCCQGLPVAQPVVPTAPVTMTKGVPASTTTAIGEETPRNQWLTDHLTVLHSRQHHAEPPQGHTRVSTVRTPQQASQCMECRAFHKAADQHPSQWCCHYQLQHHRIPHLCAAAGRQTPYWHGEQAKTSCPMHQNCLLQYYDFPLVVASSQSVCLVVNYSPTYHL